MKNIIKTTVLFALGIVASRAGIAQQGLSLNINYNIAKPLGSSFKDYINKTSYRGFGGAILYGLNDRIKVGLQSSYNDFYTKFDRRVYETNDGSEMSAVVSNSLQSTPVFAKGEYTFIRKGVLRPYAGLGAGINFIDYNQYAGEFGYKHLYTKSAFTGDAGIEIPFSYRSNHSFRIGTSYNYLPFNEEGINNLKTWGVQAGLTLPLR